MRVLLASLLAIALQAMVSSPGHAAPVPFAIDLSFPFEPGGTDGALRGTFLGAGTFHIESSLLTARGNALVAFGQISAFDLRLPDFTADAQHLGAGSCLSAAQLPVCGLLFTDGQVRGLVGQFSLSTSDPRFVFRFANTSPSLFDTTAIFQGVLIDDLNLPATVASGFVAIRPIPEPASSLLFGIGSLAAGVAARRRMRSPTPGS